MRALTASDLLNIWEKGYDREPVEQALLLLGKAFPLLSQDALAGLTIAQRDAYLFLLFRHTFGTRINGLATCPACAEHLELSLNWQDLYLLRKSTYEDDPPAANNCEATLHLDDCELVYRFPTSADLLAIRKAADELQSRRLVLESCIIQANRNGSEILAAELSDSTLEALEEHMALADPIANITLNLCCPACQHQWEIIFDIVSFLWAEIQFWSMRLLKEVHALASAYGWHEADILAMSSWRRQRYLELLGK